MTLLEAHDCYHANLQYSSIVIVQTHLISGQPHQTDECIRLLPSLFLIFTFLFSQRSPAVFSQPTAIAFSFSFTHLSTFPRFILHLTSHPSSTYPSADYSKHCISTFLHSSSTFTLLQQKTNITITRSTPWRAESARQMPLRAPAHKMSFLAVCTLDIPFNSRF